MTNKSNLCKFHNTPETTLAAGIVSGRFHLLFIILTAVQLRCASRLKYPLPLRAYAKETQGNMSRKLQTLSQKKYISNVCSGRWLAAWSAGAAGSVTQTFSLDVFPFPNRRVHLRQVRSTQKGDSDEISVCARNAVSGTSVAQKSDICFCLWKPFLHITARNSLKVSKKHSGDFSFCPLLSITHLLCVPRSET